MFLLCLLLHIDLLYGSDTESVITVKRGASLQNLTWKYHLSNSTEVRWLTYLPKQPQIIENLIPIWSIGSSSDDATIKDELTGYRGRLRAFKQETDAVTLMITNLTIYDSNTYYCTLRSVDVQDITLPAIRLIVQDVPGQPNITSITPGRASLHVAWTPPGNNGGSPITHFTVKVGIEGERSSQLNFDTRDHKQMNYTVYGVLNSTAVYAVSVSAWNKLGESENSEKHLRQVIRHLGPPESPHILNKNDELQNNTIILLQWTQPFVEEYPIMHYIIQYKAKNDPTWNIIGIPRNDTLEYQLCLEWGMTYQIQVYAWNIKGYSSLGKNCTTEITITKDPIHSHTNTNESRASQSVIMYAVIGALLAASLLKLWSVYKRRQRRRRMRDNDNT